MPIVCLRIPYFALRIALLDAPHLDGHPLVLSNPQSGRAVVLDATPEALEKGIRPGMNLREASALCPTAVVRTVDPVHETTISQQIQHHLEQVSPLVEPDAQEQGCWYIDLMGLERHYGSYGQAARRVLACADAILRARAGVADGKFTARVAAGVAAPGTVRTVTDEEMPGFLAGASVTWLPLPADVIRQLERLGIPTLGDFTNLPRRKVAARFGPAGRAAWELARGQDNRPVSPPLRLQSVTERLTMPVPATSRQMFMIGLRQMVTRAFGKPELRGRQVRQIAIHAILEGEPYSWQRTLTLKEPSGHDRVIHALALRLQDIEMPGPVEMIILELSGIADGVARQASFPIMGARAAPLLTAAIHQLKHRYGQSPVYHVVEVEPWSRIPERRHALINYDP